MFPCSIIRSVLALAIHKPLRISTAMMSAGRLGQVGEAAQTRGNELQVTITALKSAESSILWLVFHFSNDLNFFAFYRYIT